MKAGALLFDIDGTLSNTDPLHIRAFNAMLTREGRATLSHADYFRQVMGRANLDIFRDFFPERSATEQKALADGKEAAFRDLARSELVPTPGLMQLLDQADAAGLTMAAVTNAPTPNAELMLTGLGIRQRFRTIVIGDELPRGKPDPLPYQLACERLGVEPARCLAFEDSRSGVQSASRAGVLTLGVMSSLTEDDLVKAGAFFSIRDFLDPRLLPLIRKTTGFVL
jgi:HAD superfamily hydrolase (TIGR01509 family)